MICAECSRPVESRSGQCTFCGTWNLDTSASFDFRIPRAEETPAEPAWAPGVTLPPPSASMRVEEPGTSFVPPTDHPVIVVPATAFAEPAPMPTPAPEPVAATPPPPPFIRPRPNAFAEPEPETDDLESTVRPLDLSSAPAPRAADRAEPALGVEAPEDEFDERTTISARRSKATRFWTMDLPDGTVEVVVGTVIIGRQATPHQDFPGARLLTVEDPSRSVSKNHAVFAEISGQLYVEDLGSMNGVVVVRADGDTADLIPGRRVRLDNGSKIELGDMVLRVHQH